MGRLSCGSTFLHKLRKQIRLLSPKVELAQVYERFREQSTQVGLGYLCRGRTLHTIYKGREVISKLPTIYILA